jgi:hypothetical protein
MQLRVILFYNYIYDMVSILDPRSRRTSDIAMSNADNAPFSKGVLASLFALVKPYQMLICITKGTSVNHSLLNN